MDPISHICPIMHNHKYCTSYSIKMPINITYFMQEGKILSTLITSLNTIHSKPNYYLYNHHVTNNI